MNTLEEKITGRGENRFVWLDDLKEFFELLKEEFKKNGNNKNPQELINKLIGNLT